MIEERKRPLKQFVVVQAYGPYRKGDKIQPTGMYRDILMRRGVIREVVDEPLELEARTAGRLVDRQIVPPQSDLLLEGRKQRRTR